ncbi:MAG: patatin-like phospholipase family protein [Devosia sp.]|nr:patatin-like phospholipase family protein [Devosia sp.]
MAASGPKIGVALGSGGARGLAHIPYIEALDEMGLSPSIISGTSVGALIGAGWANGMTGRDLREHSVRLLGTMQEIAGRLWTTSRPTLKNMRESGISMQVDAQNITDAFLPDAFPDDFTALCVPFHVVATDYHGWDQVVFQSGPLRQAIAASLAIPALFRPVRIEDRLFIDGGATNPLPVDRARIGSDIVIAIDVNGMPDEMAGKGEPNPLDVGFVATQIMTQAIVRNTLALHPPDIYVHAAVKGFRVLEFWRVREIIAQAERDKDAFKRAVEKRLKSFSAAGEGRPQRVDQG